MPTLGTPKLLIIQFTFESTLVVKICKYPCCERIQTTAYHLAVNGVVERLHGHLKAALMSHADRKHWTNNLPIVAFKLNVSDCAAALIYECTLRPSRPQPTTPTQCTSLSRTLFKNVPPCAVPDIRPGAPPTSTFQVLSRVDNTFKILLNGREETKDDKATTATKLTTRSGIRVCSLSTPLRSSFVASSNFGFRGTVIQQPSATCTCTRAIDRFSR